MQKVAFGAGDTILTEGEDGRTAFLVISGKVEVIVGNGTRAKRVATLAAGEVFGEVSLLDPGAEIRDGQGPYASRVRGDIL